jgi:galactose mutarotase-like enzyme
MTTTIKNNYISASIKHFGAELFSLKKDNREYIWEGNSAFWGKHSPVLFPIVGTLKNNSYSYNNQTYQLSRHGFARDCNFEVIEKTEETVTFSLKSNEETLRVYPFDFELQITYKLIETELVISYKIINNTNAILPFSIGAHPAFSLPLDFEKYALEFNCQEKLNCFTLENDLLSDNNFEINLLDKKLPLSYSIFEKDALIFKSLQSKEITIFEKENPLVKVKFNDFKNLGIWTKVNAPFICIEPWLGYSDTVHSNNNILEKEGIQFVDANDRKNYQFTIDVV